MIRPRSLSFLLAFLVVGGTVACSDDDDDPTAPTTLELMAGAWTTNTFTYTAIDNPQLTAPLATLDLGILSMTIQESGDFTGIVNLGGGETPVAGTISVVNETTLDVAFTGAAAEIFEPFEAEYQLSGDVLAFQTDDVTFDYSPFVGGEPTQTPSILAVSLVRVEN